MTIDPDHPPQFTFRDPNGKVIGAGPLDELMAYLPDSRARKDAEALILDAAIPAGRVAEINSRADAVIEREREVEAREDALRADAIRRIADGVLELTHRMDAFEQAQVRATLDSLPDPDHPQGLSRVEQAAQDDLEAVHEAPHPIDKEQLEAMLASERGADDADSGPGDLPNALQSPSAPLSEEEPTGLGTRSVQDARKRRFKEPKPRKGKDFPPQPVAISLNED
jgi:hypothetical protein